MNAGSVGEALSASGSSAIGCPLGSWLSFFFPFCDLLELILRFLRLGHINLLVHKLFIVLVYSRELKRIRRHRFALLHAGDDIGATNPMRLREIASRPARRMIGMRVIKPDNIFTSLPSFPLNTDQLARINVVTVLWRVRASISAARNRCHRAKVSI